jgi:peptidoglycan/LPS O-acetylase OafA/YrhL
MFGCYRLILALTVAASHAGFTIDGFNPGQMSVVCFYVLSGFLMERQFHKLAPRGGVRSFYLDRFLRIYPVYFVVTVLCACATPLSWSNTLINFSLLPLNYSVFTGVPLLVDPAWSLACEVHFYLLVPLLAVMPSRTLGLLIIFSVIMFSISPFLYNDDFWGYICFPGIMFAFLSGMLINRGDWPMLRAVCGLIAVLLLGFLSSKLFKLGVTTGIHINVCLGYLIAIPATTYLRRFSPKVVWDRFLGLFSYPLFLVHMLVLQLCLTYLHGMNAWTFIGLSILAAGCLVVLVEKPSDLLRYRVRKSKSPGVKLNRPAERLITDER